MSGVIYAGNGMRLRWVWRITTLLLQLRILSPREAMFYAYTRNWARAMYLDSIGTISAGKSADLVLLDRDVLTISPEEMRDPQVLWTMVAGRIVYRISSLTRRAQLKRLTGHGVRMWQEIVGTPLRKRCSRITSVWSTIRDVSRGGSNRNAEYCQLRLARGPMSLGPALVANSLSLRKEKRTLRARVQIESSGPNLPDDAGFAR